MGRSSLETCETCDRQHPRPHTLVYGVPQDIELITRCQRGIGVMRSILSWSTVQEIPDQARPWRPNIVKNPSHCAHLAGKGDVTGISATKHPTTPASSSSHLSYLAEAHVQGIRHKIGDTIDRGCPFQSPCSARHKRDIKRAKLPPFQDHQSHQPQYTLQVNNSTQYYPK
ncbi:hypothetical protein ASPSYDRAFT_731490 [Aspergillus sydowii CBS 593.65]|uniref:Uncharacterized protein n=1 Tax=Aspergillus sydowii CBS 593.65 TaxID=1036612 RepID=A0A1L9TM98_9EURO|nr:uncharacterized protein ASPSYDRAFT_731490 [Aspergillus sydowii CBS 593.65]OJJ60413.1 hypothetical protein ASPSYDRAFT_731490 [Aspergillus sydowii CBS 593.65]